jgi:SAM-dependent methyltransferase
MSIYDESFYEYIDSGALRSARVVVPYLMDIFNPSSVVDIGCGTGAWLTTFAENGVIDIFGVDGSYNEFAPKILGDNFMAADLSENFIIDKKFDLAITLEVAEHISEFSADIFVQNVCRLSNNIVWSAAVPGQRGLNHINEQFPSYWIPKFKSLGYKCDGEFRFKLWYNDDIETWYRQNILLFSKEMISDTDVRDLIHYNNFSNYDTIEDRYVY